MTEQTIDNEVNPLDELAVLKERAKLLGISISGNIGVDTLRKKIQDKLDGVKEEPVAGPVDEAPKSRAAIEQEIREKLWKEEMVLVRCRIYNLNPSKRDLYGEIITVANKYLGTVRKFIPFGEATENGYHIPKVIFNDLKSRKFQQINTKQKNGKIEVSTRLVPEYNIEVLPPLTEEELQELAIQQAAAERLEKD